MDMGGIVGIQEGYSLEKILTFALPYADGYDGFGKIELQFSILWLK